MSDKRQKNQLELAFREEGRSEAPTASAEGTESLAAKRRVESPAIGEQLMEEVCERENCQQALARVAGEQRESRQQQQHSHTHSSLSQQQQHAPNSISDNNHFNHVIS